MRTMYDSTSVGAIPAAAELAAGYVDGDWPTFHLLRGRCPKARLVSITVTGATAQVADSERRDLDQPGAARWAVAQIRAGRRPTIYTSTTNLALVRFWVSYYAKESGVDPALVSYWEAHYDGAAQLSPGTVAKQYRSDTAADLDYSVVADYWPGIDPPPGGTVTTPAAEPTNTEILAAINGLLANMKSFYGIVEVGNAYSLGHVGLRDIAAQLGELQKAVAQLQAPAAPTLNPAEEKTVAAETA